VGSQKAKLKELYDQYTVDPVFDHLRAEDINFVPGAGVLKPKVMLIGEAPGKIENAKTIPFVGPAGKELKIILEEVHIDSDNDVFFTNVVKYWPRTKERRTRPPVEKEVQASRKYLLEEIELVNPIFIGLCGRISIQAIFPNVESVRSQHGKLLHGRFVPLYHPAVVLYKPEKKEEVLIGYRVLRSLLDSQKPNTSIVIPEQLIND